MSVSNGVFNNLRQKLDVLGYTQTLPLAAIPLVGALFEDLVKTTESLRDAKAKIVNLLEEKSCWELGVEPYKCDNSRLLSECNELHLQLLKQREELDERSCELNTRIRNLQTDKSHLEQHCDQLQQQIKILLAKQSTLNAVGTMKQRKEIPAAKKPFISTVRSGEKLTAPLTENFNNIKCTKCNTGYYQKTSAPGAPGVGAAFPANFQTELDKLENNVKDLTEQVAFYKRKIEARDREIRRLNELLAGGRPAAALVKDCCYKDVGKLSEDIELIQREKSEMHCKLRQYEDQMHEAMQRAVDLETQNKQVLKELDELKEAALSVETQANKEIEEREKEIDELKKELLKLKVKREKEDNSRKNQQKGRGATGDTGQYSQSSLHKLYLEECEKESKLRKENETQSKKIIKLHHKIHHLQKELKDKEFISATSLDEDKIRLKSERDFFQKEYLRLINKAGSDKEIDFLQNQVKSKDEELRILRSELCMRQEPIVANATATANAATTITPLLPLSARSNSSNTSDCVQAIVLRSERERDCARAELERVRCERDVLREKHLSMTQMHAAETEQQRLQLQSANERLRQLERQMRDLNSARVPGETQIVLLKEEIEELKRRVFELQDENGKLRTSQNQLKILQEQTERSLVEYQNKLLIADTHLEAAENRLNTLDSNRESAHNETTLLRNEVTALKKTYVNLENEKDKILAQLDVKTERAYQLEYELKACKEKRTSLEQQVKELEEKLEKLQTRTRDRDAALHETSAESKSLRQQIAALKSSRDQAIAENGRLTNDLAESQAEILRLKKRLKDSELEIDRLKQQLRQYVQEVKKAEDLLMFKEKERDEMLEHYRSLSHDAVMLEGNNQSLEVEAAEYKRQVCELETEIEGLKKELCCRNGLIEQLEDKISALTSTNSCLERQLEEALDAQRLLKVDLTARKELCDKLDIQKDKLNAELSELNEIRRKLELDNERLRNEMDKNTMGTKVSADTLEELLSKTRRDLEEQLQVDSKLTQELVRLRQQHDQLMKDLATEREKRRQHESLVHEYQVQNQELRHNITDDRFRQARTREQSPRFPVANTYLSMAESPTAPAPAPAPMSTPTPTSTTQATAAATTPTTSKAPALV